MLLLLLLLFIIIIIIIIVVVVVVVAVRRCYWCPVIVLVGDGSGMFGCSSGCYGYSLDSGVIVTL